MTAHYPPVSRVGVVGAGTMGAGIAEVCARAGTDVLVVDADQEAASRGRERATKSLHRAAQAGKLDADAPDQVLARVRFGSDLAALADRELVIEAVPEDEQLKRQLFALLDKVVEDDQAILATNTSSIPVIRLAMATRRPHAVVGIHFSNPVPVMGLVELVPSLVTAPATLQRARAFAGQQLGKEVITSQDRAGFILNALLIPFILSAVRMLESGFATAADIDTALVAGANQPMGPLALADLIGLDTLQAISQSLYAEFKEPLYAPPPLLLRKVEAGFLGRKSGYGFFSYSDSGPKPQTSTREERQ